MTEKFDDGRRLPRRFPSIWEAAISALTVKTSKSIIGCLLTV